MKTWIAFVCLLTCGTAVEAETTSFPVVREQRPRIFIRDEAWQGPTLEKIKQRMTLPEYQKRWKQKVLSQDTSMNYALRWVLEKDVAAGRKALDRFMTQTEEHGGHSPSYWGIHHTRLATLYDWLYDHPDFTAEKKKDRVAMLEKVAEKNIWYLKNVKENPFYSRFSGTIAALTTTALAIHGDSPKADEYLRFAYECFREKTSTIRQAEDGGTGGSSYGYHHQFPDLAHLVAAWRSATDWDAARWIQEEQGNWLERQMLFQIWMTYPSGRFVKDGDGWGRDTSDGTQYRMSIDIVTSIYQNGFGRTWADMMHKRLGMNDYHATMVWEFFIFNDPEIKPRPLSELGRAEVFSPDLLGMVCWRSGWDEKATIVHFRVGEGPDTHSTRDQGKFIIYRERPLALKSGDYIKWRSPQHRYYTSPWSANSMIFTSTDGGEDPSSLFPDFKYSHRNPNWPKGMFSWEEWKVVREKSRTWATGNYEWKQPMGRLLKTEANDEYARAVADLSLYKFSGERMWDWQRELVFLDYKYLLVLDRVRSGPGLEHRWTLHTTNKPKVKDGLAMADNGPARLFCKTLLPIKASIKKVGGPGYECDQNGKNMLPPDWKSVEPAKLGEHTQMGAWRLDVRNADGAAQCVYLNVFYPTGIETNKMPKCSVKQKGKQLEVKVGNKRYTFKSVL